MAARVTSRMEIKASCAIKYDYICEHCGYQTGIFKSELSQVARHRHLGGSRFAVNLDVDFDGIERVKEKALLQLTNMIAVIEKMLRDASWEIVIANEPFIAEYYNEIFGKGKSCPNCKTRQTWYPAASSGLSVRRGALYGALFSLFIGNILGHVVVFYILADYNIPLIFLAAAQLLFILSGGFAGYALTNAKINALKKQYENTVQLRGPRVTWGEPMVELTGAPLEPEHNEDKPEYMNDSTITMSAEKKEDLGHWYMLGLDHENILYVSEINDADDGNFQVVQEDFYGVPLSRLLVKGVNENAFRNYIFQLLNALEYLHQQTPVITHNAVYAKNILIDQQGLLKLSFFDDVQAGNPPENDINMVGRLIGCVGEKYVKRYETVIKKCNGSYKTIDEVRQGLTPIKPINYSVIIGVVFIVFLVFVLLLNRLL